MPQVPTEQQKLQSWSQRFTQVASGATLEYPDKANAKLTHPALFLSKIAWGADETRFRTVWQMFEYLRRNISKYRRESELACSRLAALKWKLIPADKMPEAQATTEIFQEFLESLGVAHLIESQWDAIDWGWWIAGLQWAFRQIKDKTLWLPKVAALPQWGFEYVLNADVKLELRLMDNGAWDEERLKANKDCGIKLDALGSHLPERGYLPLAYKATSTTPWGEGLIQAIYRDLYYHDTLEYRQKIYGEMYDIPALLVKVPRGDAKALAEAEACIAAMGGAYRGISYTNINPDGTAIEGGWGIEFVQPQRSSGEVYNPTIMRIEDKIHSVYSGGQLDSDKPVAGEGSLALSRTHQDTTDKVTAAQARAIQVWYNTVIDWCWEANPELQVAKPPRFEFITSEEIKGNLDRAATIEKVAAVTGIAPPDSQIREEFDYEEVTADNPSSYVKPAAPQPFNPFSGIGAMERRGIRLESAAVDIASNDVRINAADSYAGRVGAKAVAPILSAIKVITDRYRDPKAPADPKNTADVLDRMRKLGELIPTIGKDIPIGAAARGIDINGLRVPLDLLPLVDSLFDAQVSGFLGGYAHGADQVHGALAAVMARDKTRGLENRTAQIYSRGLALEGTSVYPDGIYPATDAWKLFVERSKQPMSSEAWALAEAAIKQRSIGYAYVADQIAVAKLTKKIEEAIAMGYSQEQFIAMVNNELAMTGLTTIQPYYLETVFRTVVQQEYGRGQSELVNQIDGGLEQGMTPIIWGYRWSTNLGKEPHHPGHLEMNEFAAPVGHKAWAVDGWAPGCDYRCACARIMVLWIVAQDRHWLGKDEPVKAYPGIVPRFQLVG